MCSIEIYVMQGIPAVCSSYQTNWNYAEALVKFIKPNLCVKLAGRGKCKIELIYMGGAQLKYNLRPCLMCSGKKLLVRFQDSIIHILQRQRKFPKIAIGVPFSS